MADFLSDVGLVVTQSISWMMQFLDVIVDTPALTVICIAVPLVNVAVNLLRRLIRL